MTRLCRPAAAFRPSSLSTAGKSPPVQRHLDEFRPVPVSVRGWKGCARLRVHLYEAHTKDTNSQRDLRGPAESVHPRNPRWRCAGVSRRRDRTFCYVSSEVGGPSAVAEKFGNDTSRRDQDACTQAKDTGHCASVEAASFACGSRTCLAFSARLSRRPAS